MWGGGEESSCNQTDLPGAFPPLAGEKHIPVADQPPSLWRLQLPMLPDTPAGKPQVGAQLGQQHGQTHLTLKPCVMALGGAQAMKMKSA